MKTMESICSRFVLVEAAQTPLIAKEQLHGKWSYTLHPGRGAPSHVGA
jgi:hypothetical protein